MNNQSDFLFITLGSNKLDSIIINKEGHELSTMYGLVFREIKNGVFIFDYPDVETKYIIDSRTIKSVFLRPFKINSVSVLLTDGVMVELNFK